MMQILLILENRIFLVFKHLHILELDTQMEEIISVLKG